MWKRLLKKINKSPINYFSDLFIVIMVLSWIVAIPILAIAAWYAMVKNGDSSVWSNFSDMVKGPLEAGGAIWMIKNAIQHAIANNKGKVPDLDFPKVEGTEIEKETTDNDICG